MLSGSHCSIRRGEFTVDKEESGNELLQRLIWLELDTER